MTKYDIVKLVALKPRVVKNLKPRVRKIYERRKALYEITEENILAYEDDQILSFPKIGFKDLKPEVKITFDEKYCGIKER